MACLDTTVFLDLMVRSSSRNASAVAALIRQLKDDGEEIVTTRFNLAELYVGVERSMNAGQESERVSTIVKGLPVLEFDEPAARLFASHTAHLQRRGRPAGDMDVLIAATAMARGHALVTRNTRHFKDIPDLSLHAY